MRNWTVRLNFRDGTTEVWPSLNLTRVVMLVKSLLMAVGPERFAGLHIEYTLAPEKAATPPVSSRHLNGV